jgi:hypothetical protein
MQACEVFCQQQLTECVCVCEFVLCSKSRKLKHNWDILSAWHFLRPHITKVKVIQVCKVATK